MLPLNIGLIGLGRHGQRYVRHLLKDIPNCRLTAVCRRDATQGNRFAEQHGLRFYSNHQDLLVDPQVEAIILVIPPAEAIPVALDVIRHNKPLLIEKPLGCTTHQALQVCQESSERGVPVMVAQTLRYEEAIIQLKAHANKIGKWQYLALTNRLESPSHADSDSTLWPTRGTLLEIGVHQIDQIRFLTGQDVTHAYCELERRTSQGPDLRAWASLQAESGLPCLLDISRVSKARVTRAEIIGETGQLIADWTSQSLTLLAGNGATTSIPFTSKPTIPQIIEDFARAVQTGLPMPITGLDGLRAIEIVDACYESANTRKTISIQKH